MADLPETWSVPVVRADFTGDAVWEGVKEKVAEPTKEGFGADVDFVEDLALAGLVLRARPYRPARWNRARRAGISPHR